MKELEQNKELPKPGQLWKLAERVTDPYGLPYVFFAGDHSLKEAVSDSGISSSGGVDITHKDYFMIIETYTTSYDCPIVDGVQEKVLYFHARVLVEETVGDLLYLTKSSWNEEFKRVM